MTRFFPFALVVLVASAFLPVWADEDNVLKKLKDLDFGELVELPVEKATLPSGIPTPVNKAPAVATVLTRQDLVEMGAGHVRDALASVPGIHISTNTLYKDIYVIRGVFSAANAQTLILLNGAPIASLVGGNQGVAWNGVPIEQIERIEVIRGPGSTLYGADAVAGVISITTKTAHGNAPTTEAGVRAGNFEQHGAWLHHGQPLGNGWNLMTMVDYAARAGDGGLVERDQQSFYDDLTASRASRAPSALPQGYQDADIRLDATRGEPGRNFLRAGLAYQGRREVRTALGYGYSLDPEGRLNTDRWYANLQAQDWVLDDDWRGSAALFAQYQGYQSENQRLSPQGARLPGEGAYPDGVIANIGTDQRLVRAETTLSYRGLDRHHWRLGMGYEYANIQYVHDQRNFGQTPFGLLPAGAPVTDLSDSEYAFLPRGTRHLGYVYAQDVWQLSDTVELTLGLRYDTYFSAPWQSDQERSAVWNPRLALVWSPTASVNAKFLYGEAFRPPNWEELYARNNPSFLGNPDLQPETMRTWEAALEWRPHSAVRLAASIFYSQWRDAIMTDAGPGASIQVINGDAQDIPGGEIEVEWRQSKQFKLAYHIAGQWARLEPSGRLAPMVPHYQMAARSVWNPTPDWQWSVQARQVGERGREFTDPRPPVAEYTLFDLIVHKKLGHRWEAGLTVQNILDTDYAEPSPGLNRAGFLAVPGDYPMAGRAVRIELRYRIP